MSDHKVRVDSETRDLRKEENVENRGTLVKWFSVTDQQEFF